MKLCQIHYEMSQTGYMNNARMLPVSDPQIHRPNSVDRQGLPHQERVWPKTQAQRLRVGTLNVGTMTGRGRAIADMMKDRKLDVLCIQETRWTGNKAKELGEGFKLIYSGATRNGRNGVGIILSGNLKNYVTEVHRYNDRMMRVALSMEDCTLNIFSVYAPQMGCADEEKDRFWAELNVEVEKIEVDERCIVAGDLNDYIGQGYDVIGRIHGENRYGERNDEGEG